MTSRSVSNDPRCDHAVDRLVFDPPRDVRSGCHADRALAPGAVYRYFTVPRPVFEELLAAASKGAYFNRHIRDGLPYQRVS